MGKRKLEAGHLDALLDVTFDQRSIANFHNEIYKLKDTDGLSILEAITEYCDTRAIDPEDVVQLIDSVMMSDLAKEATEKRLLKPKARVRLDL